MRALKIIIRRIILKIAFKKNLKKSKIFLIILSAAIFTVIALVCVKYIHGLKSTCNSQKTDISYYKAPTVTTPATTFKSVDSSYTVPKLNDVSSLKYAITVTGTATGVQLAQNFDPNTTDYDLNALAAGQTISIYVKAPGTAKITINGNSTSPNKNYNIKIKKISKDNNIKVTVKLENSTVKTYTIHTYNRSLPTLNYKTEKNATVQNGIYTFALSPYLIRMDTSGNVIYYRSFEALKSKKETLNFNFKPVKYTDGTIRFTYGIGVDNDSRVTNGYNIGICVVMDENYKEIKYINLQAYGWHSDGYLDDHDFILLSDNHWICESYTKRNVNNIPDDVASINGNGKVIAGIIQEVNNGKVVMEFDTTNYPFFYETSQERNNFISGTYQEYVHINSLCIDPSDGNLIVSMRNQYSIYKINRKTESIMWVLGGNRDQFNLNSYQKFIAQHAAYFAKDGSLMIYNNNTNNDQSNIINISLDEKNKKVKFFKSYTVSNFYGDYCGNAFDIGSGNLLIDWGSCYKKIFPIFNEVSVKTGEILNTLTSNISHSYRTYKTSY